MKICIFGASSSKIDEIYIKRVEELGQALAKEGHSLIFGAGNDGLMGAAARGFTAGGGKTIGVIPNFFKDESLSEIFKCSELIFTDSMRERKHTMEEMADAFLIVPGGIGTFEEFFEVLTLKQLGRHNKPIIIYDIKGYYSHLEKLMEHALKEEFLNQNAKSLYKLSESPDKVMEYISEPPSEQLSVREMRNS